MFDDMILLVGFLFNSIITIQLALTIFGDESNFRKVLLAAVLSGSFDYLIKEITVPSLHLYSGLHLITGVIFLTITFYFVFKFNIIGSLCLTILSYVLSAIGEFAIIIILITIVGVDFFKSIEDSKVLISFYGMLGLSTLIIPLVYLKKKNIQLLKLPISRNIINKD